MIGTCSSPSTTARGAIPPGYLNLAANPVVGVLVKREQFAGLARLVTATERPRRRSAKRPSRPPVQAAAATNGMPLIASVALDFRNPIADALAPALKLRV